MSPRALQPPECQRQMPTDLKAQGSPICCSSGAGGAAVFPLLGRAGALEPSRGIARAQLQAHSSRPSSTGINGHIHWPHTSHKLHCHPHTWPHSSQGSRNPAGNCTCRAPHTDPITVTPLSPCWALAQLRVALVTQTGWALMAPRTRVCARTVLAHSPL